MIAAKKEYITNKELRLLSFYIIIVIATIYSNTIHQPWHFDDIPNIVDNYYVHVNELTPKYIINSFVSKPFDEGKLYRPIASLSFGINWFFNKNTTYWYHILNITIHIVCSYLLIKCIRILLNNLNYKKSKIEFITILSVFIWALNPIQTQAVTYIVQRMASMAAMFYLAALYFYLRARNSTSTISRFQYFSFCLVSFLLALGCKENSITFIPSLLAVEYIFFNKNNETFSKIVQKILIIITFCFVAAGIYYAISHDLIAHLNKPFGSRPFSLGERLLTQPSILLFYLSLLFYPAPARLSLDHSFPLSTSLWYPWTTLPAILIILGLVILAFIQKRKNPLVSFAILFFFINHLVESSIIPLELIFEHRNYLPSMFLFLAVAAGIQWLIDTIKQSSRLIYYTSIFAIPVILICLGVGTYNRNEVWADEESLWADALTKAPNNARPYAKLGEIYGWYKEKSPENLQTAVALLTKALDKETPRTSFKAAIVGNIGKVYANYGMLDQAIASYHQSLQLNPDFVTSRFDLANALALQGNFSQALEQIDEVLAKNDQQSRFFNLKAMLLLWLDRPEEAALCCSKAMHKSLVNKERYFYNTGVALGRAGHYEQGQWFLQQSLRHYPEDRRILYSLIENRLLAKQLDAARAYVIQLFEKNGVLLIKQDLSRLPHEYAAVPINTSLIAPLILDAARVTTENLDQTVQNSVNNSKR